MSTVKSALAQKSGALIHVRSGDMVVEALRQMRENRVRSVLVIDDDVLVVIVTQGDCAIKVLLPGLDAKQTPVGQVMTGNPVTVKPDDRLEGCMAMMAARGFRHLPVLDAGKVVGVISIGDVVKDIIRDLEHNVGDLMTVKPDDRLEGCMAMMAARGFRHLPVLDAGKVVGVISIGDVVKDIIRDLAVVFPAH